MIIDKTIIEKSLTDAINKSHQHLTLNENVRSVLDKFARSTVNRKTEKGILINNNGEEVSSKNGGKASVTFDNDVRGLYEEHGALHMEHNHPSVTKDFPYDECLSEEDMFCLTHTVTQADGRGNSWEEYAFKSITAEGTNGTRMTLVRGDYFNYDDNQKQFAEAVHELSKFHEDYVHEKYGKLEKNIFDDMVKKSREKYGNDETLKNLDALYEEASKKAINQIGAFHEQEEFKAIQKKFRGANCKLIISTWE